MLNIMNNLERKCIVCDEVIPAGRVKALPEVRTCLAHSNEGRYYVNPLINSDEDYSQYQLIKDPEVIEQLEKYKSESSLHGMPNVSN